MDQFFPVRLEEAPRSVWHLLSLTSEQIPKSALRREEALVAHQITPEKALEAVSHHQLALAESMAVQEKNAFMSAGPGPADFPPDSFGAKVPSRPARPPLHSHARPPPTTPTPQTSSP